MPRRGRRAGGATSRLAPECCEEAQEGRFYRLQVHLRKLEKRPLAAMRDDLLEGWLPPLAATAVL